MREPEIPDWPCDWPYPHFTHFWSDGKMGFECPGLYGDERDERIVRSEPRPTRRQLGLTGVLAVLAVLLGLGALSAYAWVVARAFGS